MANHKPPPQGPTGFDPSGCRGAAALLAISLAIGGLIVIIIILSLFIALFSICGGR